MNAYSDNKRRDAEFIKSFVRRGRKLNADKTELCTQLLPIHAEYIRNIFNNKKKKIINFEIGFGNGEFIFSIAQNNPEEIFIGCEPYKNGMINLLEKVHANKIENILIWNNDARLLLKDMPNHSIDKVFILFPDPWPKARHHKRRIINTKLLDLLKEKINSTGKLFIATDHAEYRDWIINVISAHKNFKQSEGSDWVTLGEINTHYRKKASKQNIDSWFGCFYKI